MLLVPPIAPELPLCMLLLKLFVADWLAESLAGVLLFVCTLLLQCEVGAVYDIILSSDLSNLIVVGYLKYQPEYNFPEWNSWRRIQNLCYEFYMFVGGGGGKKRGPRGLKKI